MLGNITAVEVQLDDYWVTLIVAVILPILTALVTKRFASGGLKSVVLLALAVITGFFTQLLTSGNGAFDLATAVRDTVVTFVIAVAVHYGLLQPLSITGKDGAVQKATGNVGLGSNQGFADEDGHA